MAEISPARNLFDFFSLKEDRDKAKKTSPE